MNTGKIFTALFAAIMLVFAIPAAAEAAPIEISASVKSSLDRTIAKADSAQAGKISSQYDELLALQKQQQDWNAKIKALHTANGNALSALRKQIKQIEAVKLDKLEAEAAQTRERYKPLFSLYSSLNKRIEEARSLNNIALSSLLRFQAGTLKIPVQLARSDIKAKEAAWQTAKENASNKMKQIRGVLTDIDPVEDQIKANESGIRTIESGVKPVLAAFKQAARKGDAGTVQGTLESLVSLSRQINDEKQRVFNLEAKISDIVAAAKAQMP